jgi:uncharacterized damage-inducible protein DinB
MKEIFVALSRYNRKANEIVYSYIDKMTKEQLCSSIKAYYGSIVVNTFHILSSDTKWLSRLSRFREPAVKKASLDAFMKDGKAEGDVVFSKIGEYSGLRSRIDLEIIDLIKAISEEELAKEIEIPFGQGTVRLVLWKLLLQWFNHHTHHRGQVSIQLDLLGIEHDFSSILDKID